MTELVNHARNAGLSLWAFASPTESDFDVYRSKRSSGDAGMAHKILSTSNGARIFKHTVAAVALLAGLFFVTAGTLVLPSYVSLIAGGGALMFSVGCYICMLRHNQSEQGRGLPFCHAKPLHIKQTLSLEVLNDASDSNASDSTVAV